MSQVQLNLKPSEQYSRARGVWIRRQLWSQFSPVLGPSKCGQRCYRPAEPILLFFRGKVLLAALACVTTALVQDSYLRKSLCLQTSGTSQKLSLCLLSSNGTHTQVPLALISRAQSKTRLSGFRPLSHNIKYQSHPKTLTFLHKY